MKRKLLALLLAVFMVFSLFGCDKEVPEDQTETTDQVEDEPPPPPEPTADEVYSEAVALLQGKTSVTLDISENLSITSGHMHVTDTSSSYALTYNALDTEAPLVLYEESINYTNFSAEVAEDEEDIRLYSEIYADGTLYIELEDTAAFSGALTAVEAKSRYIPVVMLDAALYGEKSVSESGGQKTITFAAPTAAESWAIPETAEMIDASGAVVVGSDGNIVQMNYSITYKYGSSEITWEIESKPRAEVLTVAAPENPYRYNAISSVDALWLTLYSGNALYNADTISIYSTEQSLSQAGGVVLAKFIDIDMHTENDELMAAVDTTLAVCGRS